MDKKICDFNYNFYGMGSVSGVLTKLWAVLILIKILNLESIKIRVLI